MPEVQLSGGPCGGTLLDATFTPGVDSPPLPYVPPILISAVVATGNQAGVCDGVRVDLLQNVPHGYFVARFIDDQEEYLYRLDVDEGPAVYVGPA